MANVVGTLHTLQFTSEELHLLVKALEDQHLSSSEDNDYGHNFDSDVVALRDALQKPILDDYHVKSLERQVEYKKQKIAMLEEAVAKLRAVS